jgi:hypothetical protein
MAERYCKACNGWHDLDRPWPAACYPKLEVARSGLPLPFVVSDTMEPVQHPCTGEYLTSKRAFRRVTKANGCIEVGNDPARLKPFTKPKPDRKAIRQSIDKAFAQYASR